MTSHIPLSSSELATLWMTYQQKTMSQRLLEHFIEHAEDEEAKEILTSTHNKIVHYIERIKQIFEQEGAVVPVGFTEQDVNTEVPKLYDHLFDIMFLRLLKQMSMGLHTLHLSMAHRDDIVSLFQELTEFTQGVYSKCVDYLQKKGVLVRPPVVSMPKEVKFAKGTGYMNGMKLFSEKRALNTVEVAHIHYAVETNILGMQMITGFAQAANEPEVRKYFIKGKELSKKIIANYTQLLLASDIQASSTWAGKATNSQIAPFSDKLMMYCTSIFCSFGLGSNALGTAFSLRNDLPLLLIDTAKDILTYGQEGRKIMARNGWMEEPPQMEDRIDLTK
ncbi:hypothetical protein AS180_07925 [Priestia veravalensis]|uniref:DUF3231 family protein n=1 Tax=Priestia veravalensis TaxID=1414648 RepID=A0A0V8JMT4_9BACI|nr:MULTISPECIES: DUF3231 family protein [Priestia]KSU88356.1 hypothetical protein AS180_07925 [Priestia veravalensis]SCC13934.1 Protein of unknown function [Priestia flexa]